MTALVQKVQQRELDCGDCSWNSRVIKAFDRARDITGNGFVELAPLWGSARGLERFEVGRSDFCRFSAYSETNLRVLDGLRMWDGVGFHVKKRRILTLSACSSCAFFSSAATRKFCAVRDKILHTARRMLCSAPSIKGETDGED